MNDGYIGVGEFIKPHGISGELLFAPYNPKTDALESALPLFIEKTGGYIRLDIEKIRPVNKGYLIKLSGVHSIDEAIKFKKIRVFAKKIDIALNQGEYLISDLIGLNCYNDIGKNIGTASEIYQGETDIIEIKSTEGTYLIPMTDYNISSIDTKNLKIIVRNEENYKI
ncbi:MAG: ribosome maturation factor RimM [bacterium]